MYKYADIKTVHLEITEKCQAACSMCGRNQNGGADNPHLKNAELSLSDCKKIFTPEFIKQLDTMYICGNFGDPIMAADTLAVFKYFRENNPTVWLSMNTNAGARDTEWWTELATIFGNYGEVIFSVDGLEDTNHLYRQNVVWSKVKNSMRSFIGAGGKARWDFIIFSHNEHQVDKAEQLSKEWGFRKFTKKKTARFFSTITGVGKHQHQSVNRKGEKTVLLSKPMEKYQNSALNQETALVEKYGSMSEYYDSCNISCKVIKEKSIFITAEGYLLPCCWTANRMYKWWHKDPKVEQIWGIINEATEDGVNLHINTLEHAINHSGILQRIKESWGLPSINQGKLLVCAQKCGKEFDVYTEQFK